MSSPTQRPPALPFVPALRFHWATRFYDTVMQVLVRDTLLRRLTVDAIAAQPHERIADFGCGTGSLSVALAQRHPKLFISGFDIDPQVLGIAKAKAVQQCHKPQFQLADLTDPQSLAQEDVGRYHCVASSLVFHHLLRQQKSAALAVVNRLLRPGGRFILVDWGPGSNAFFKAAFYAVRLFDGMAVTRDNARGDLPNIIRAAGFRVKCARPLLNTVFGTLWIYESEVAR